MSSCVYIQGITMRRIVWVIISIYIPINTTDPINSISLEAIQKNNSSLARESPQREADSDALTNTNTLALLQAIKKRQKDIIALLTAYGTSINPQHNNHDVEAQQSRIPGPLSLAIIYNATIIAQKLL